MRHTSKATIAAILGVSTVALRKLQKRHGIADDVLCKPDEFAAALERAGANNGRIRKQLSDPQQRASITLTINALKS